MPEIEEEEITGSQSEDSEETTGVKDESMEDIMSMFNIDQEEDEKSVNDKTPAKEDVKAEIKAEPKMMKVKHNKEEIEVDVSDDKIPEYVQKSLALDKERERKNEYEKGLDRAAKLAGFNSHEELLANLDMMEQNQARAKDDAYTKQREELIEDLVYNGVDREKVEKFIDNHPLLQEAKKALIERDASKAERDSLSQQQAIKSQWDEVFTTFSDIEKRDLVFNGSNVTFAGDKAPDWLTPEVLTRLQSGYKPIDAITLSNMGKIQTQTKTKTQQRMIKEQHLGLRSQVETNAAVDKQTAVPDALANAFEMFGLPKESAKKYMKK